MNLVGADFRTRATCESLVVDVGSAGDSYTLTGIQRVDVDIAEARLAHCELGVCGNIESLPLQSEISDLTVCIGTVLNYCSLAEAISELTRLTKFGARLILHVELSNGFEYFGTRNYRADAAFVKTFYKGGEKLWIYSDSYVRRLFNQNGLSIERVPLLSHAREPNASAHSPPEFRGKTCGSGLPSLWDTVRWGFRR